MGHRIENNCVGCERCARCGRDSESVYYCDDCGDYAYEDDNPLYYFEGEELCKDCLLERLTSKICDDCDDTRCSECGSEDEILYLVDGSWYCEDCVLELFEKVCLED